MNSIDIVYKLGSGSTHNNNELRYSLRSLKNFVPLGKVYVVGFLPDFVQNIIHIPAEDAYLANKDGNLISKLILATVDPNLSEEFINMSDDQCFLQTCTYDDIKIPYIENKHLAFKPGARLNRWETRLQRSVEELKRKQLSADCYESHAPVLLNKKLYAATLFQYPYGFDRGMCGNTLYFNTLKIQGQHATKDTVARIVHAITDKNKLEEAIKGRKFLNYTDDAINDLLLSYMMELFPEKSIYEK